MEGSTIKLRKSWSLSENKWIYTSTYQNSGSDKMQCTYSHICLLLLNKAIGFQIQHI